MISIRKKVFVILALILIIFSFKTYSFGIVNPTTNFYSNDYANILDEDIEEYIINRNVELEEKTGAQIVVVTVKNLEGNSLEEYATELFRKFGIGDKDKNNGVLLLLALEERQFRIEVGYGLEGTLTDGKTGRIQDDYIIPYLKNDDWNNGVKNGFNAILQEVYNEYNIDSIEPIELTNANQDEEINSISGFLIIGGFFVGIALSILIEKSHWKACLITLLSYIAIVIILEVSNLLVETMWLMCIINMIIGFFFGLSRLGGGGGRSGGHYSGGSSRGGYSGGRRRTLWRRRFIWRRSEVQEVFKYKQVVIESYLFLC